MTTDFTIEIKRLGETFTFTVNGAEITCDGVELFARNAPAGYKFTLARELEKPVTKEDTPQQQQLFPLGEGAPSGQYL